MKYYVYILECSNKALYTGITTDVERRFKQHQAGEGGHYTSYNRPKKICYYEECGTRSEALKREAQIKRWPRTKKLALINSHTKTPPPLTAGFSTQPLLAKAVYPNRSKLRGIFGVGIKGDKGVLKAASRCKNR